MALIVHSILDFNDHVLTEFDMNLLRETTWLQLLQTPECRDYYLQELDHKRGTNGQLGICICLFIVGLYHSISGIRLSRIHEYGNSDESVVKLLQRLK